MLNLFDPFQPFRTYANDPFTLYLLYNSDNLLQKNECSVIKHVKKILNNINKCLLC